MTSIFEQTSALLEDCLDYQTTVMKIADLLVMHLSTWCLIDEVMDDGRIERVAGAHANADKSELVERLKTRSSASPHATRGVYAAIRTGNSFFIPEFSVSQLSGPPDDENRKILTELGADSYMCIPLKARGQTIGSLMLIRVGQRYTAEDLQSAQEVAGRCALAMDNARMYRKMQEALRVRDEFISIAAHEFRTPLMPLTFQQRVVARIMEKDEPPGEQELEQIRTFIQTSGSQLGRLSRLVHDLMDTTLLNCRKMDLRLGRVDLSELVREIIRDLKDSLRDAECEVELRVQNECFGIWDRSRLERAIVNLITNATKYGAGKPIQVTLSSRGDPAGERALIEIRDQGVGIRPEDQNRIFLAFVRGNTKRSTNGVGLGLYIVQQIIREHSGTITVKSDQGAGSTFTLELPIQTSAGAATGIRLAALTETELELSAR